MVTQQHMHIFANELLGIVFNINSISNGHIARNSNAHMDSHARWIARHNRTIFFQRGQRFLFLIANTCLGIYIRKDTSAPNKM